MQDLNNKVFLITGATEGIGKAATAEFAKRGAIITIVGRLSFPVYNLFFEMLSLIYQYYKIYKYFISFWVQLRQHGTAVA